MPQRCSDGPQRTVSSHAHITTPVDQAAGLRRLFAGRVRHIVPLIANPHVAFAGVVLERITTALAAGGASTLLVDAADSSPPAATMAHIDLAACVEQLDERTAYLAARGLPRSYVDTRGSAASLLTALGNVAPKADTVVLHGEVLELARVFTHCELRPLLITSDHVDAVKHAYAAIKILAQRCGLMTFDVLMVAPIHSSASRRARAIMASLDRCAEGFMGALLQGWAHIDPAVDVSEPPDAGLCQLLLQQRRLGDTPAMPSPPPVRNFMPVRAAPATPTWRATLS